MALQDFHTHNQT